MNKFLKLAIIPMAFLVTGTTSSCSVSPKEIALITDVGDIDDGSFNQEAWEAVRKYATKNHKTYDFYRPFNDSDFARICSVKQAVAKGAEIIVMPGCKFASTCMKTMDKYPKVHFLLLDTNVNDGGFPAVVVPPGENVCCVGFKCEYSGYIAGYTIAQDLMQRDYEDAGNDLKGLRDNYGYGYMGGTPSSGVYEFGFGYIQGICNGTAKFIEEKTGKDIGEYQNTPKITINYDYAGVFAQDDAAAIKIKSWFTTKEYGLKVVFPCGGKLYQSATEATQYYNKHYVKGYDKWFKGKIKAPRDAARWVGVDSDQYIGLRQDHEIASIYTSALKGLKTSIKYALDFHFDGEWWRIGGARPDGEQGGVGEVRDYKWILGLDSVFGERGKDGDLVYGDFVGIPQEYDKETKIMRGYDNYNYGQVSDLYFELIGDGAPIVYGGDGSPVGEEHPSSELKTGSARPGYPDNMVNWEFVKARQSGETSFRKLCLGNYPAEKIVINDTF